jgi:chemotaxis signal transduction protein
MTTAPTTVTLLSIVAGGCTYLVAPHAVDWMRAYHPAHPPTHDARGLSIQYVDLGALLHNAPAHTGAGHLLGVQLRRRSVALIVQQIADLAVIEHQPLAPLIANRLKQPWIQGVALRDDQPVIVLDLRTIALGIQVLGSSTSAR